MSDVTLDNDIEVIFPSQCKCGHLFLEKYLLSEEASKENAGFCWCGFCRTKLMIKREQSTADVSTTGEGK